MIFTIGDPSRMTLEQGNRDQDKVLDNFRTVRDDCSILSELVE